MLLPALAYVGKLLSHLYQADAALLLLVSLLTLLLTSFGCTTAAAQ
jgi:hypothetical protein